MEKEEAKAWRDLVDIVGKHYDFKFDGDCEMAVLAADAELTSLRASLREKEEEVKRLREEVALLRDALRAKMSDNAPF
jgi:hypothetical protein